jgi:hypothetical protein
MSDTSTVTRVAIERKAYREGMLTGSRTVYGTHEMVVGDLDKDENWTCRTISGILKKPLPLKETCAMR